MKRIYVWILVAVLSIACEEGSFDDFLDASNQTDENTNTVTATNSDCVLYVDEDAEPGGDGLSWNTALTSVEEASQNLDKSDVNKVETECEIWIKGELKNISTLTDFPRSVGVNNIYDGFSGNEIVRNGQRSISSILNASSFRPGHDENSKIVESDNYKKSFVNIDNEGEINRALPKDGNLSLDSAKLFTTVSDNLYVNGLSYLGQSGGQDNNGSSATLRIRAGSQYMYLDGNEIDSNVDMWLNYNSQKNVNLCTNGGRVGIGTGSPDTTLEVNGTVKCEEIIVAPVAADFVFDENYNLMSLEEVESFVKENKHLPEIPSAAEIESKGLTVGLQQARLLQKVEELTLHLIDQNRKIKEQSRVIDELRRRFSKLEDSAF